MNFPPLIAFALLALAAPELHAQRIPMPPAGKGESREIGRGGTIGGGIREDRETPEKKTVRITYIAVTPERSWTDAKGRSMTGALLAFESGGEKQPAPENLTLIREGKVRLLRKGAEEPSIFPLAQLSEEDQEYIRKIDEARKQKVAKPEADTEN